MASKQTAFLTGRFFWAKVLGEPRPNYGGDAREWAFEFEPDEEGLKILKQHKLDDRLKNKYEDRGKFITLRKKEFSADGRANDPIRVYDKDNNSWDATALIGNGSKGNVKLDIRDYGPGKKHGVYPVAIRITDLVSYTSSEFGAMDGDTPPAASAKKGTVKEDFLNDDLPFE